MGWTFTQGFSEKTVREHLDKLMTWTRDNGATVAPLKSAMVGATYYAAVETKHPDGTREVWAAVVLTKRCPRDRDGYTFGYKDMDETCGPFFWDCPASILDLLTPTRHESANEWREACRANAAKKAAFKKVKPKPGQKIRLAEPMKFTNGAELSEFIVMTYLRRGKNRVAYQGPDGGLYRITGLAKLQFEVVA